MFRVSIVYRTKSAHFFLNRYMYINVSDNFEYNYQMSYAVIAMIVEGLGLKDQPQICPLAKIPHFTITISNPNYFICGK